MNPLDYYVMQARSQGQADAVTKQQLIEVGWPVDQVDAALSLGTVGAKRSKIKVNRKLAAVFAVLFVLILAVILASALKPVPKVSFKTVTRQFMVDVQKGEQAKADALESPTLKAHAKKTVNTSSFEKYCKGYGQSCLSFFTNSFMNKASLSYSKYTSTSGAKGQNIILTLKTTNASTCSYPTDTKTLTIGLIPNGNTWLIDSIDPAESGGTC